MNWDRLLNRTRTRELLGGRTSRKEGKDIRPEFERDYDRAVFATATRRLQDKTQLFPLERHDAIRTRLTHSLEVATIAKNLAKKVGVELVARDELTSDNIDSLGFICMTAGLVHDFGNPPFGHAGEAAICDWCEDLLCGNETLRKEIDHGGVARSKDFIKFDGNAQTLRLIAHLQMLADRYGLNLTAATFATVMKYMTPSDKIDPKIPERKKIGFFHSEKALVTKVRDRLDLHEARHPLAFLVEAADDTVYSVADLEDGIRKGVLEWDAVRQDGALSKHAIEAEKEIKKGGLALRRQSLDEARVQMFRTIVIGKHIPAAADVFLDNYDDIMNGRFSGELLMKGCTQAVHSACKKLAREFVFPAREVLLSESMGWTVLHELMDFFWRAAHDAPSPRAERDKRAYKLLSRSYRELFEAEKAADEAGEDNQLPLAYHRLQLVVDYIAGMTDSFACGLHQSIRNVP